MDFSGVVCLPPSVIAGNGLDGGGAGENDDEPVLVSLSAAPSPQSEAVANELQELSLQPELTLNLHHGRNPNLPPLSERKNGKWYSALVSHVVCPRQGSTVMLSWYVPPSEKSDRTLVCLLMTGCLLFLNNVLVV